MTRLRSLALGVALALAAAATGCYGKFALTRKVYAWNGTATGNKFANSAIMWGLLIIPVYELGTVIDLLILNPIEVLSGKNPVSSAGDAVRTRVHGHDWVLTPTGPGQVAVTRDGAPAFRYTVEATRLVIQDAAGREAVVALSAP